MDGERKQMTDHVKEVMNILKLSPEDRTTAALELLYNYANQLTECEKKLYQLEHANHSLLEILAEQGGIHVIKWERDCDCAEWTSSHKFKSREEFEKFCDLRYAYAEGPVSISVVSKKQYTEFVPESHDRVLEAFEDGKGTSVVI
jgi:hypothetical protein